MVMINATPRRPSIFGMVIGAALLVAGIYLVVWKWETLRDIALALAGVFLTLFGLGILISSIARRRS